MDDFKKILRTAIGKDSQKEFAKKSGLSAEHINRMLNNENMNRPSIKTLKKIIEGAEGKIDSRELYKSCGYLAKEYRFELNSERKELDIGSKIEKVAEDIESGFKEIISRNTLYGDIRSVINAYKDEFSIISCNITFDKHERDIGDIDRKGEFYINCRMEWQARKDEETITVTDSYFALFFVRTKAGNVMLTDVATDFNTLARCGAVPAGWDGIMLAEGCELNTIQYFAVSRDKAVKMSDVAKGLLDKIFGRESPETHKHLGHTEYGKGFEWRETPPGFAKFMVDHRASFAKTELEKELIDELTDGGDTLAKDWTAEELDGVFKDYTTLTESNGAFNAAAAIIQRETKDNPECDFEVRSGMSEDNMFPPCIFVPEGLYCDNVCENLDVKKMERIEAYMLKYAKELRMPTFGETIVYNTLSVEFVDLQKPIIYKD